MRNYVFGKTLMITINIGKTNGTTFYQPFIHRIFHKEFGK